MGPFNHEISTTTSWFDDGVEVAAPTGINVLVVGAGVGGLTAALECHRRGHNVRILERATSAIAGGDMFTIGLSGRKWVKHYPTMAKELDKISIHNGYLQYRRHSGEAIGEPQSFAQSNAAMAEMKPDEMPIVSQLRPLWHAMMHHQVQRFGIPISYGKKIVLYYEVADRGVGGVLTQDGDREEADLVIAADGLHSRSQNMVLGGQSKGKPSGRSVFRASVPLEVAMEDPVIAERFGLMDGNPKMTVNVGPEAHCVMLSYVDKNRENGRFCWGMSYREHGEQDKEESWSHTVSNEDVLKVMERVGGWSEAMKSLVSRMPKGSIVDWPLLWRNPHPCTHSEAARVLQIGDAAHSFLPTSGNGATQAIEDAITIAVCLHHAGKNNVPLAVRTHSLLRSDRVSCAQLLGFYNAERVQNADMSKVGNDPSKVQYKIPKWIWMFNPEPYADENYEAAAASLQGGPSFKNTNTPPGCEPQPWTIESVTQQIKEGKDVELSGDWS